MKKLIMIQIISIGIVCLANTNMLKAQTPNWHWATMLDGIGYNNSQGIAAHATGGCFVTGRFDSSLFTPIDTLIVNSGNNDGYVARFSYSGTLMWIISTETGLSGIRAMPNNGIRLWQGYESEIVVFDSTFYSPNGTGVVLVDIDEDGNVLNMQNIPDLVSGHNVNNYIVEQHGDKLLMAGTFPDTLVLADTTFIRPSQRNYLLNVDLNTDSSWAHVLGSAGWMVDLDLSSDGNTHLCFYSSFNNTSDTLLGWAPAGHGVVVFSPNGQFLWRKNYEGSLGGQDSGGICLDHNDDVLIYFKEQPEVDDGYFVFNKLGPNGSEVWNAQASIVGIWGYGSISSVTLKGDSGYVVLGGANSSLLTFGQHTVSTGNPTVYIAQLDGSGNWNWALSHSTGQAFHPSGCVDADDEIYFTGMFEWEITFGPFSVQAQHPANSRTFVAKLSPNGVGIDETINDYGVQLYPNPTKGILHLRVIDPSIPIGTFLAHDLHGREVYRFEPRFRNANYTLDLRHLSSGLYLLTYRDNGQVLWNEKVVVE